MSLSLRGAQQLQQQQETENYSYNQDQILSMEIEINQSGRLLGDKGDDDNNWALLLTEDWHSLCKNRTFLDTSVRSNHTTVTPEKVDHHLFFFDPEFQLEYRRTIKRFTRSMRQSDQTRSIVKRIRLTLEKKYRDSGLVARNESEEVRGKVYKMLVSKNIPV